MKNKILIIFSLALFLICLNGISAMISSCGDGYCDSAYSEADPLSSYYCPGDCGVRVNETWCNETYPRECPSCSSCCSPCGSCSECTISRISNSTLNNWCNENLGTENGSAFSKLPKYWTYIFWLIFLLLGIILGYLFFHKRKKR
jgi:hypothetical protein